MATAKALLIILKSIQKEKLNDKIKQITTGINKITAEQGEIMNIDSDSTLVIDQKINLVNQVELSYIATSIAEENDKETLEAVTKLLKLNSLQQFSDPIFLLNLANVIFDSTFKPIIDWKNETITYLLSSNNNGELSEITLKQIIINIANNYNLDLTPLTNLELETVIKNFESVLISENVINLMSNMVDSTVILKQNIDAVNKLKAMIGTTTDKKENESVITIINNLAETNNINNKTVSIFDFIVKFIKEHVIFDIIFIIVLLILNVMFLKLFLVSTI